MTNDPRVALKALIAALEHHLETARNSDVVSDAVFEDAEARMPSSPTMTPFSRAVVWKCPWSWWVTSTRTKT